MRRILIWLGLLALALVVLPPLWFRIFPVTPPELPPPGQHVPVSGGVRVNVLEQGSGPPVVLVHGLPGSAYDWRPLLPELAARGRHVVAYDRVGYAHSDPRRNGRYTMESNAEELLELLDRLDLRRATVVGWSYGGGVGMLAAARDADHVARLVLVGSVGPGIEERERPLGFALLASRPVMAWVRSVPPVGRAMQRALSRVAFSGAPEPDWWLPTLAANFATPHTPITWREETLALTGPPPDPSTLALPILVVHGDDDRLVPLSVARELDRRAPRSKLVVVPGGSHMLPITHAALLADEIVRFETAGPPAAQRSSR